MIDRKKYRKPELGSQSKMNGMGQVQEGAGSAELDHHRRPIVDNFVEETLKTIENIEDMDYEDVIDIDFD